MKNIGIFLFENFHFLVVTFSVHLNRHVFVMRYACETLMLKKIHLHKMTAFVT